MRIRFGDTKVEERTVPTRGGGEFTFHLQAGVLLAGIHEPTGTEVSMPVDWPVADREGHPPGEYEVDMVPGVAVSRGRPSMEWERCRLVPVKAGTAK